MTNEPNEMAPVEDDRARESESGARRQRETTLFKFGLAVAGGSLVATIVAAIVGSGDLQKWGMALAQTIVTGIVSALGGYAVGKGSKDK